VAELPLGGGHAHVYVTRAAVLAFQRAFPLPFEEARRELTRFLLLAAPYAPRRWAFSVGLPRSMMDRLREADPAPEILHFIAYVVPDGDLQVVAAIEQLARDAPRAHIPSPPLEDGAARWDRFLRDVGLNEVMQEVRFLRAALHGMAADWIAGRRPASYVFRDTQSYVDYYVAKERTK
jgi:hypothetical protein